MASFERRIADQREFFEVGFPTVTKTASWFWGRQVNFVSSKGGVIPIALSNKRAE